MNKHFVATTPDGTAVHIDLVASEAAKQVGLQPQLLTLAQEIISQQNFTGKSITLETHMGRFVGTSSVVKVSPKDIVFYAKPVGNDQFRKYVKNHSYTPTHYLTLSLHRDEDDAHSYLLTQIIAGRRQPDTPAGPNASATSQAFWADHAYVWEPRSCQPQTITKDCPWETMETGEAAEATVDTAVTTEAVT
jgi:hypothetical protein